MTVVGFLTMMVFGVGYQLLPRLFGHALYSRGFAIAHWWLANAGLAGMVVGFVLRPHVGQAGSTTVAIGGLLYSVGALGFVYNMWRTFNLADARVRMRALSRAPLPTQDEQ